MQRNDTRSRSFRLKRIWTGGTAKNTADSPEKATTPATPGAFDYYSVNDPGAADAYENYARRQRQQQQQQQQQPPENFNADGPLPDSPIQPLTFPDSRDSDDDSDDSDAPGHDPVSVRMRNHPANHQQADRQSSRAAADLLQLPTRTPRESKRRRSRNWCATFCARLWGFTFLAFLLCATGGGLFAVCVKLAADDMMQMQQEVFHISRPWMEGTAIGLTAAGCLIMAISALILVWYLVFGAQSSSDAAAADRRESDAAAAGGGKRRKLVRPASKTPPLVLMLVMYPALVIWLLLVAGSVAFGMLTWVLEGVCYTEEILPLWDGTIEPYDGEHCRTILAGEDCVQCIYLFQFHFLFPEDARKEDMWLCGTEIEAFCGVWIGPIVRYWILCQVGCWLVVVGVSVHLTMLTYTRTRVGEERLMQEKSDLRYIRNRVSHALLSASANSIDAAAGGGRGGGGKKKRMNRQQKRAQLQQQQQQQQQRLLSQARAEGDRYG